MALINNIENQAEVLYDGVPVQSNTVSTILLLPPTLLKTVDKLIASIGDELTYTIVITNVALQALTNLPFSDVIPAGTEYVNASFTVNGTPQTPTIASGTLSYTIPNIGILGVATITFRVLVVGGEI